MGYVENNLGSGEQLVMKAKVHWAIVLPGVLSVCVGVLLIAKAPDIATLGTLAFFYGFYRLIKALILMSSIELAITNKRVIAKIGTISRQTIELNHAKVEGLMVDQSILGRILNYGTIVLSGTGGLQAPIPSIAAPMAFRKAAIEMVDSKVA